jgi:crotonobetainyl-CoA:carnitine CoA-transferase CaiB-like acyl-CoA transferase
VIKVERPVTGDEMRNYGPPFLKDADGNDTPESAYYLSFNRNKESITVDLSTTEGQDIIRRIARQADVLVENFKVGDLARHGLDYQSIRNLNPSIVYCSVTGYGQDGPYARRPGLDSLFQAQSGLMSVTGEPDRPPMKVGVVFADLLTGAHAAFAIMLALRHREMNGGLGQHIDMSLLDVAVSSLSHRGMDYLISGIVPERLGNSSVGTAPAGHFSCSDAQIIITAGIQTQFRKLCEVIGRPELSEDPRFRERRSRIQNAALLESILNSELSNHPRAHWLKLFKKAGIMAAPINNIKEALEDEQVRHRGMVVHADHPLDHDLRLLANPIRLSETPVQKYAAPPRLGQDTGRVLSDLLGMDAAECERLQSRGII